MIIIFTGNGKGKTSAAITTALRALHYKKKVVIVQFLKTGSSGEIKLLNKLKSSKTQLLPAKGGSLSAAPCVARQAGASGGNYLTIHSFGKRLFTNPKKLKVKDFKLVNKALECINKSVIHEPFLIILDEILIALKFKLIKETQILDIIKQCNIHNIHLVLTGRGATKRLLKEADLVTDMKNIKHPFDKGKKAVKGIDY